MNDEVKVIVVTPDIVWRAVKGETLMLLEPSPSKIRTIIKIDGNKVYYTEKDEVEVKHGTGRQPTDVEMIAKDLWALSIILKDVVLQMIDPDIQFIHELNDIIERYQKCLSL